MKLSSYIWYTVIRVKGEAISLLPEHANIPAIDRELRKAMLNLHNFTHSAKFINFVSK